jgi:hypothetical protein
MKTGRAAVLPGKLKLELQHLRRFLWLVDRRLILCEHGRPGGCRADGVDE